jgi:hypothetical protein
MRTPTALLAASLALTACKKDYPIEDLPQDFTQGLPHPQEVHQANTDTSCPAYADTSQPSEIFERATDNYHELAIETARILVTSHAPINEGEPYLQENPYTGNPDLCWTTDFDCVETGEITSCQSLDRQGNILLNTTVTPTDEFKDLTYMRDIQIVFPRGSEKLQAFAFVVEDGEHASVGIDTRIGKTVFTRMDYLDETVESGGFFCPDITELIKLSAKAITKTAAEAEKVLQEVHEDQETHEGQETNGGEDGI